jgi:hypothetical protein
MAWKRSAVRLRYAPPVLPAPAARNCKTECPPKRVRAKDGRVQPFPSPSGVGRYGRNTPQGRCSSGVEQRFRKAKVGGSIPSSGTRLRPYGLYARRSHRSSLALANDGLTTPSPPPSPRCFPALLAKKTSQIARIGRPLVDTGGCKRVACAAWNLRRTHPLILHHPASL